MRTTGGKKSNALCNHREREQAGGEKREQVSLCLYIFGAAALRGLRLLPLSLLSSHGSKLNCSLML